MVALVVTLEVVPGVAEVM
jgi:hypothetical protein